MIHDITLALETDNLALSSATETLIRVGIAYDIILCEGVIYGQDIAVNDLIALPHIVEAFLLQELSASLTPSFGLMMLT
jgi:hypothetical protein